ncbi:hypothetical protein RhiirA5_373166 [Rhizophagus irregularis]|uniref:Uncharacterized protein n=1 Tax=Rhizophagus irregularis TaxID=588596 RepID=A0A2I1EAK9_9GLOM|nr:hypothetical protein RhiirA5_373166 [Rhizophagus irregularis]PKC66156.1 hypothetical protein RhiirA1_512856 [Rhizophagus irregularis]PKY19157.1 hypothetical protein RhiirB3_493735 [Rhizophagus irregularis]
MGFLNECTIEPLRNKIGQYPTSLENISTEKGERRDKAQQLYNQYKKISNFFVKMSEQQLTASRERRKEANKERARIRQKTDIIIELLTGPALICEVSGGLPAGCPKKIWTDKVDGRHEGYD